MAIDAIATSDGIYRQELIHEPAWHLWPGPLLNLGETDRALYRMVSTASPVLHIAERMLVMRRFEEKVQALAEEKLIAGLYHLYIGQEAGGAAVIEALQTSDLTLSNHRNHGHIVGRGADLGRAFAELLGRSALHTSPTLLSH